MLCHARPRVLPSPEKSPPLRLVLLSVFMVFAQTVGFAQWHTAGSLESYQVRSPAEVELRVSGASILVTALSDAIVRVALTPEGERPPSASWAVTGEARGEVEAEISDRSEGLRPDDAKPPGGDQQESRPHEFL